MVIRLFYIKPGLLCPLLCYDACVTRGTPTIVQRNPAISLLINENCFGGSTFPNFPRYCQTFQGIHHDSFYDSYLVLLTPNLSLVCVGTPILNPSYHATPVRGCQTLVNTTMRTPLLSWSIPHFACTIDPDLFSASFPTNPNSWMSLHIYYLQSLLNVGQPCSAISDLLWNYS